MKSFKNLALAALLGVMSVGAAPAAFAQDDPTNKIVSLEYQQADVRDALRALFRNVGVSYSISPDVQGTITVDLKNVTFETALQNITRQVEATYRIEGGVYTIVRREQPTVTSGTEDAGATIKANKVVRRVKIRSADPMLISILIGTPNGSANFFTFPEMSQLSRNPGGMMGGMGGGMMGGMGGGMMGGMGGGMMGGMGGGMMGGMGGGMMGGMGGGMMGGMGGGMMGGMGGMGGGRGF